MSRFTLAFACFFKLLFTGKLPAAAADRLPEEVRPKALPPAEEKEAKKEAKKPEKKEEPKKKEEKKPKAADLSEYHRDGALGLMALLQREGRLIDFLREGLDDYEDEDIGAAVRDIHRGCKKVLDDHFTLEAVMPGEEEDEVTVPKGFDPSEIRLIGEVSGDPPFKGTLRHAGLRATKVDLPKLSAGVDRTVIAPAEVEL
jgi:hypothetical protein